MFQYFIPRHQKLVNACYDNDRGNPPTPNIFSTNVLLNNLNENRVKLDKVLRYLLIKLNSDLKQKNYDKIITSLNLMFYLIKNEEDEIPFLVEEICKMLMTIMSHKCINWNKCVIENVEYVIHYMAKFKTIELLKNKDNQGILVEIYVSTMKMFIDVSQNMCHDADLVMKGCINFGFSSNFILNQSSSILLKNVLHIVIKQLCINFPEFTALSTNLILEEKEEDFNNLISKDNSSVSTQDLKCDDSTVVSALFMLFYTYNTTKIRIILQQLFSIIKSYNTNLLLLTVFNLAPNAIKPLLLKIFLHSSISIDKTEESNISSKLFIVSEILRTNKNIHASVWFEVIKILMSFQLIHSDEKTAIRTIIKKISLIQNKNGNINKTYRIMNILLSSLNKNSLNRKEKCVISRTLCDVIGDPSTKNIPLGLAMDLIEELPHMIDEILESSANYNTLAQANFHRLYKLIRYIENIGKVEDQNRMLQSSLLKYKNAMIVAGYQYIEASCVIPNKYIFYYTFHANVAEYIQSVDYIKLANTKKESTTFFTVSEISTIFKSIYSKEKVVKNESNDNISTQKLVPSVRLTKHIDMQKGINISDDSSKFISLENYFEKCTEALSTINNIPSNDNTHVHPHRRKIDLSVSDIEKWKNFDINHVLLNITNTHSKVKRDKPKNILRTTKKIPIQKSNTDFDISDLLFHDH
ncbi:hypothetical protein TPHA_0G00640 [Tetrapisispora phaffii CBS 4417]|uniref:Protein EFR3 n=1 Tax=Tetrapisispora phaffii (strain ATCC 24235 / CBS 4417 / NBRC 1672 / NRRL Y-8282 / UCD 70-5) TaxID=1071381 RepID=G8BVH2_TETPH|nr:hypothetical protein TPHA_0G00640 [Tetrapisispora phaffii CBS 4417]CCE63900.1 hypothetical protein TPHA_0G00640 [Tetrapisispora phaffii CBS 4417]